MYQRKRGTSGSLSWRRELAAHPLEGEECSLRGSKKVTRNGSRRKKTTWADNVEEHSHGGSGKRVMVVVDQSKESKLAFKWALSHVVQQLDVLTLLHVQPSIYPKQLPSSHGGSIKLSPRSSSSIAHSLSQSFRESFFIERNLLPQQWINVALREMESPPSIKLLRRGSFFSAKAAEEARRKNEVAGWEIANSYKALVASSRPEVEVEIVVVEGEKGPTIVAQTKKLEVSILVLGQKKNSVIWTLLKKKCESLAEYCINNTDCLTLAVRKKRRLGGYLINSQWQKDFWLLA